MEHTKEIGYLLQIRDTNAAIYHITRTEMNRNTAIINNVSFNFAQDIELCNFNKDNTVSILCNVMEHIIFK